MAQLYLSYNCLAVFQIKVAQKYLSYNWPIGPAEPQL